LEKAKAQLEKLQSKPVTTPTTPTQSEIAPVTETSRKFQQELLQKSLNQLEQLAAELELRLGLLQVQQGQINAAIKTWTDLKERSPKESSLFATTTAFDWTLE
jgi:predicted negative regulator of RcsB-dependent stress response